ncbi:hypothetical protein ETB97_002242 [Aspergillus alliaceus]|uniref:Uncharacterized protein n=1 Tax=Petromyces alliaceus TaxID=209559 RepID=A0A8H5ZZJ4_PETAA|nr:hypothetical protein ETB97_002242 [Aspergillus burnettii]
MSLQTKPDIHGQNESIAPENNERRKRKRKIRDEEEAAYILDDLWSGNRVLYLQEVLKVKNTLSTITFSCFERIIPDLADLVRDNCLKMDSSPPGSKATIESSTKAIQDWFRYEGRAFDINCYERHKKNHDEWERNWSILHIEHQLAHTGKPTEGCCLREGVPEPKEPEEMDYFPENPSAVLLSRLLAIMSKQPHIDKWWRWRNSGKDQ